MHSELALGNFKKNVYNNFIYWLKYDYMMEIDIYMNKYYRLTLYGWGTHRVEFW